MDIEQQFMAAVIEAHDAHIAGTEVLPMLLAQACVKTLGVAGAGLSITDELRVPLGASDEKVARAESLQTTLGEGPCLDATQASEALIADEVTMEARWPMFHRALLEQTPFRSVASIPLRSDDLRRFGALDLYSANLETLTALSMDEVSTDIAEPIAAILFDAPTDTIQHGIPLPLWLNNRSVTHRMNVWVAVGILIEHANVTNADALAALRAYAYGHDTTLDDVADLVSSQRLRPAALLT